MKKISLILTACFIPFVSHAVKGDLDTTFGSNGLIISDELTFYSALQEQNSLLYLTFDSEENDNLKTFDLNGRLNNQLSTEGIVIEDLRSTKFHINDQNEIFIASEVDRQTDEKLEAGIQICRRFADGTLNTGFGINGCYSWFWPYNPLSQSPGFPTIDDIRYSANRLMVSGSISWPEVAQQRFILDLDLLVPADQHSIFRFNFSNTTDKYESSFASYIQPDFSIINVLKTTNGQFSDTTEGYFSLVKYNLGELNTSFGNEGHALIDFFEPYDPEFAIERGIQTYSESVAFTDNAIIVGYIRVNESNPYLRSLIVKRFFTDGTLDSEFGTEGVVEISLPMRDELEITSPDTIYQASRTKMTVTQTGEIIIFAKMFYWNSQTDVANNKVSLITISSDGNNSEQAPLSASSVFRSFSNIKSMQQLNDGRLAILGWQDNDGDNRSDDSGLLAVFNWDNEVSTSSSGGGVVHFLVLLILLSAVRQRQ